jgi:septum formation protein
MAPATGLYLASQSPRRARLLEQVGLGFTLIEADVAEEPFAAEAPEAFVERIARKKAAAGRHRLEPEAEGIVIGADTAIHFDGRILGKPADAAEARQRLATLAGREHEVLSAVAVTDGRRLESRLNRTAVRLRPMDEAEIADYVATGEPLDKAGAYAIQGMGGILVERIQGSYSAVMGLPLYETDQLLRELGEGVL